MTGPAQTRSPLADIAAGVTLFHPRPEHVAALVAAFSVPVPHVFAYDNGGVSLETRAVLDRSDGVRVIGTGDNVGVGAALNRMAEAATAAGARYLLLLDQDSEPSPELILGLRAAMGRLSPMQGPAMVGPVQRPVEGRKTPRYPLRRGVPALPGLDPVEFMATSGSLLDLAAFARIGPFREDYFIDAIDLEWCFRAWAAGHSCWVDRATPMAQCVGSGIIRARWLPVAIARQPLFRMETYIRNTVYGWRLAHVPRRWKLTQMAYLPLQTALYWSDSGYKPAVLGRLLRAAANGFRGRLGRPAGAP
ncbi:glycosyltransferase family 2 protein [Methylobacterium sp. WL9]|uniref:glycosyltransferase n=1 Tax=Methylobacterium sp. WL9 TaxID=2603898 RepID=UPI0011C7752C|nr:glycosyltransferase family 2 protein [Methylobacterium sp. WL9]TXN22352.1 glycosyltransferase [Methylobacterium sp. WL9]